MNILLVYIIASSYARRGLCLKDQNGKVLKIGSLIIGPPDSSLYLPNGDQDVIRGGPHIKGFLPYHKRLASLSLSPAATSVPTDSCSGKDTERDVQAILVGTYAGWLGRDNMGDEIVSDLFFDLFTARVIKEVHSRQHHACVFITRASPLLSASGSRGCTLENSSSCDFAVLGGGSTVHVDYVKHISGAIEASRPIVLFGSGHQSGLRKKSTTDKYMAMLCAGSLLGGVRGSYTQAYLKQYGCNTTRIIRDSALLAQSIYPDGQTALRPKLKDLIGGSEPRHVVVATLKSSPRCLSVYNSTLRALLDSGRYAVVLQAVDRDSLDTALDFATKFNRALTSTALPLIVNDEYQDWAGIQDLYRHASVALSSRLHSGVLALSASRPTLYYAKNSKYLDLMGSIGLRQWLINPTSFVSERRVLPADNALERKGTDVGLILEHELGLYLAGRLAQAIRDSSKTKGTLQKVHAEMTRDYDRTMEDLFRQMRVQDPVRYESTMCCKSIGITRSAVTNARKNQVLIEVKCLRDLEPRGDDEICLGNTTKPL